MSNRGPCSFRNLHVRQLKKAAIESASMAALIRSKSELITNRIAPFEFRHAYRPWLHDEVPKLLSAN